MDEWMDGRVAMMIRGIDERGYCIMVLVFLLIPAYILGLSSGRNYFIAAISAQNKKTADKSTLETLRVEK